MESIFGTLGRRKKNSKEAPSGSFDSGKKKGFFTSTPNLNRPTNGGSGSVESFENSIGNNELIEEENDCDVISPISTSTSHYSTWHKGHNNPLNFSNGSDRRKFSSSSTLQSQSLSKESSYDNISSVASLVNTLRRSQRKFAPYSSLSSLKEDTSKSSNEKEVAEISNPWGNGTQSNKPMDSGVSSGSESHSSLERACLPGDVPDHAVKEESIMEHEKDTQIKRDNLLVQGIKKFNTDPKRGIEFLIEKKLINYEAKSIARFLKDGEGLSKTAVGNYLGEHIDFNQEVLKEFVHLHNFKNLLLVPALRQFLWSFRLPGEAQKIDRMMEAFAKWYCEMNPGIFSTTDACYVLSYSVIMLNTTLHNPCVKHKSTVEDFIKMNRDIDCGKSLKREFLISLYNSIQSEPFKIPPEDGDDLMLTFFNPVIEGWLWKQGARYKSWKCRWFILTNSCLYYFKYTTDKTPRGIIPLENIEVQEVPEQIKNKKNGFGFVLYKESVIENTIEYIKSSKTVPGGGNEVQKYSYIYLSAQTGVERIRWVEAIRRHNSNSRFYTDLTLKKMNMEALNSKSRMRSMSPSPRKKELRKSQISDPSCMSPINCSRKPLKILKDREKDIENEEKVIVEPVEVKEHVPFIDAQHSSDDEGEVDDGQLEDESVKKVGDRIDLNYVEYFPRRRKECTEAISDHEGIAENVVGVIGDRSHFDNFQILTSPDDFASFPEYATKLESKSKEESITSNESISQNESGEPIKITETTKTTKSTSVIEEKKSWKSCIQNPVPQSNASLPPISHSSKEKSRIPKRIQMGNARIKSSSFEQEMSKRVAESQKKHRSTSEEGSLIPVPNSYGHYRARAQSSFRTRVPSYNPQSNGSTAISREYFGYRLPEKVAGRPAEKSGSPCSPPKELTQKAKISTPKTNDDGSDNKFERKETNLKSSNSQSVPRFKNSDSNSFKNTYNEAKCINQPTRANSTEKFSGRLCSSNSTDIKYIPQAKDLKCRKKFESSI